MNITKSIAAITAAGALTFAAAPLVAAADPVGAMSPNGAVMAYTPSQFANSPTTTNAFGDAFNLTFDGSGRFVREGRAETPQGPFAVTHSYGPTRRQASMRVEESNGNVDRLFSNFREQLRSLK
jgi:hypothetical protein